MDLLRSRIQVLQLILGSLLFVVLLPHRVLASEGAPKEAVEARADHSLRRNDLSLYDHLWIRAWNFLFKHKGYGFRETFLLFRSQREGRQEERRFGPYSIGEAMVLLEKSTKKQGGQSPLPTIQSLISVGGEPAGEIEFQWRPAQEASQLAWMMFLLRFDRAYLWPQWILDQFPDWFEVEPHREEVSLHWRHFNEVMVLTRPTAGVRFLMKLGRQMQLFNPAIDELHMEGVVTHYGSRTVNKQIFIVELESDFNGALRCRQRVRTHFHPLSPETRPVQGFVQCGWSQKRGNP